MWDMDHSASRGRMACRGLYVFQHESKYGNAPSHQLFDKIKIQKKDENVIPRSAIDYEASIEKDLPEGVTLHKVVSL